MSSRPTWYTRANSRIGSKSYRETLSRKTNQPNKQTKTNVLELMVHTLLFSGQRFKVPKRIRSKRWVLQEFRTHLLILQRIRVQFPAPHMVTYNPLKLEPIPSYDTIGTRHTICICRQNSHSYKMNKSPQNLSSFQETM